MAKYQPYVFGLGMVITAVSMIMMGFLGAPRRHWDVTFQQAPFSVEVNPAMDIFQASFGIGGMIASIGVLMFIAIAVVTVFFGKPLTEADLKSGASGIPQGVLKLPSQVYTGPQVTEAHNNLKGTVILVAIFFVCFVAYYFTNWKILSFLWKVG